MTTKVLGEAVGIQWQGVQDHTQGQPSSNGVPLLIGSFKRGRIDKPMIIHNGNIRSELGYEPDRSDYLAVQSMLDMGVPNVNVLRVANGVNAVTSLEMSFGTIADADIGRIVVINLNGTDFSKDSGFYIKIYGNKYNNFNGLEDTSTIFEKSIDGGSIRDLLLDSSYQEFLWKYPLDISIENSDNDLSLVTLSLGENTEYLEHVFQINIAQNPPMYLDFDASWKKLSADGKNISFCFHRHGS